VSEALRSPPPPVAREFLSRNHGPIIAVYTESERGRNIVNITFASAPRYRFYIDSRSEAERAFTVIVEYLQIFRYYYHIADFQLVYSGFRKSLDDLMIAIEEDERTLDKAARFRAVALDNGLSEAQLREAIENWEKANGETTQRDGTTRAKEPPRPDAAAVPAPTKGRLACPTEKWKGSPEGLSRQSFGIAPNEPAEDTRSPWKKAKAAGEKLPDYVARVYAAERAAGTLSKATLRAGKDLYTDYFTWRRRRHLPPDVHWLRDLPTGTQKRDQQFAEAGINPAPASIDDFTPAEQEVIRRYEAGKKRGYRSRAGALRYSNLSMD
jgi:hypothetical protein